MLNESFSAKLQKSRATGGWTLVIWPDSERIDMALGDNRSRDSTVVFGSLDRKVTEERCI